MEFLKKLREMRGMSQKALAESLGVDENTVWRWEKLRATPSMEMGHRIGEVLGTTVAELLNGPTSNEIKINILWEVDDLHVVDIKNDEFSIGFHGSRDIGWFSVPDDVDPDEFGKRVANELKAAKAAREARAKTLKKLNG